jgi:hypothetical protein
VNPDMTIGELYGPAMEIVEQAAADAYFEALVQHMMQHGVEGPHSRAEAERITRSNLGYYAGYYSNETRARVERLFRCAHPIFGAVADYTPPTPEQALEIGFRLGDAMRGES